MGDETPWSIAYVDESGNSDLDTDKAGTSNLFILAAVLVEESEQFSVETAIREICRDLCGGSEIASKNIGKNHERRLKFLERITPLPLGYYGMIVNKDRIRHDYPGLEHKRSFYKFINRKLYVKLTNTGNNLRIVADEHGSKEFMTSFDSYIHDRVQPNLFELTKFDFHFSTATISPILGVADLIAGTLRYCFDEERKSEFTPRFRELLKQKEIALLPFSIEMQHVDGTPPSSDAEIDDRIRKSMTNRVLRLLEENEDQTDPYKQMQVETLSILLSLREYEERANQALHADALIARLKDDGFEDISKQAFTTKVIGGIRNKGIILSGTSEGYRLALSLNDIHDYLNHGRNIIEPMLARINKARETVKADTAGKYEILDGYALLKDLADISTSSALKTSLENEEESSEE